MIGSRLTWALGSLALFAVALHCGSTGGSAFTDVGSGGPCETVYKGLCGKECAADTECADGLHCGPDKTCTADCSPDHECSTGSCSARGRCESGGGGFGDSGSIDGSLPDGGVCADTNVTLTKILPKVVFLLDQSSSMWNQAFPSGSANDCNGGCRWTVLKDVLIGPNNNKGGLLKQLDGEAEIAIELYSATDGSQDGDDSYLDPPTTEVCPRFNGKAFDGLTFSATSYAGAEALLRNAKVDDDTPTGPAIRAVVGLAADGGVGDSKGFAALESTAPKVLVLVTDGEPGT
ncbi:MAG TPA: hypothetical protein VM580_34625, partial [Labilithrix sp.]|nr:hypothetical protein [Labilithrix sp.]